MSSVVIHLVVPTFAAIATGLFPRRTVFIWAPFAIANDFDFIFNFFGYYILGSDLLLHRAIFHNIFIFMPTLVIAFILWRRMMERDPELALSPWRDRWAAFGHVRFGYASVLITFFLASHVLLDMFQGGITPLWPFWNVYVFPEWYIFADTTTGELTGQAAVRTGEGAPVLSRRYPWITPEHFGILLLSLAASVIALAWETYNKGKDMDNLPYTRPDDL